MEFGVLGPLEAREGWGQIALTGTGQRALLVLLLLSANRVVSSDRLIDELWGEAPPESGSAALRMRISQLRKALGSDLIETRAPGYLIRVDREDVDLFRFERLLAEGARALDHGDAASAAGLLRDALALWRGDALAEFAREPFAQPAISRLEDLRLGAFELRFEADLALGRAAEVIGEIEELVARNPLRERLRGQLMLALYRSGRQAEALDAYQEGRAALVDGLGIEPGRALRALQLEILRQGPALELERTPGRGQDPPSPGRVIVVASLGTGDVTDLVSLAEPLAARFARELILTRVLPTTIELTNEAERLHETQRELVSRGLPSRVAVFTSEQPGRDLARLATEQEADLLLLAAGAALLETGSVDPERAAILRDSPCDVGLLVHRDEAADGAVLVPFGGTDNDWAAVELAAWIARARGVALRLAGAAAVPEADRRDASRLLSHASLAVQRAHSVSAEPVLVAPGPEGILEQAACAGLLVAGLSGRWRREGLGDLRLELIRRARPPVLLVHHGSRPGGLAPKAAFTRFTWSLRP